jgi:hypothetical protein
VEWKDVTADPGRYYDQKLFELPRDVQLQEPESMLPSAVVKLAEYLLSRRDKGPFLFCSVDASEGAEEGPSDEEKVSLHFHTVLSGSPGISRMTPAIRSKIRWTSTTARLTRTGRRKIRFALTLSYLPGLTWHSQQRNPKANITDDSTEDQADTHDGETNKNEENKKTNKVRALGF